jgi:glycosyltransferase involved in cell wall biosynthesis
MEDLPNKNSPKRKLAIIASRFPYPLNKGDKLRLFHQIKYLSDFFEIHLFAINEEKIAIDEQKTVRDFCRSVTLFDLNIVQKGIGITQSIIRKEPIQVGYFYSKSIEERIKKELVSKKIEAVYCQLSRTAKYGLTFKGPVIIDYQDCFSKNYERAYQNASGIKKWFYKREWQRMLAFETKINHDFVGKTIISDFDKKSLPFDSKDIVVIPNGVDPTYYHEQNVAKEFDILFSGNLNYQPNIDAALNIIKNIYPILKDKKEAIRIGIAGNTDNKEILNSANDNIIIMPKVRDMRTMYAKTAVYIAPLFTGAGLQNKLLEAMSMGIPCVATNITNLSLKAQPNKEIMEAKDINELAEHVLKLLRDPKKQKEIGQQGKLFIHKNYSWQLANNKLKKLIEKYL